MENYNTPSEEQESIVLHEEEKHTSTLLKRIYGSIKSFTYLEIAGIVAIMILIITTAFDFQIGVKRRPWLNRILGVKTIQQDFLVQGAGQSTAGSTLVPIDKDLQEKVLPSQGVELPVTWGSLGKQLVKEGVIDQQKIEGIYAQRGGMPEEMKKMLIQDNGNKIKFTPQNSPGMLNLFWALGLGNKNEILDKGEMQDKQYGGANKFASTGGWTLATGDPMQHYSKHLFMNLTPQQQAVVDRVSQNIYRPCCGNSTHFPDCNHGMAMLGLLELMASQGVSEQDMYKYALTVNSYWFPDTYLNIAKFKNSQGFDWQKVNPEEVLGAAYSSSQGYQQIKNQVEPVAPQGGSGCSV